MSPWLRRTRRCAPGVGVVELPLLDCHAHVATTVTERQVQGLGTAIVFAMTRDPEEAAEASRRYDRNILWACGAHPSFVARGGSVDIDQFVRRTQLFAIVGEVGLDRRSGNLPLQEQVFVDLLDRLGKEPVLVSVHSAGCSTQVVRLLRDHRHPGALLHWFTGTPEETRQLVDLGYYFSVNTEMNRHVLDAIPYDRVLPETDFPAARRRTGAKPGDTGNLETVLAEVYGTTPEQIRRQFYRNLRRVSVATGAIDRMTMHVVDLLMSA